MIGGALPVLSGWGALRSGPFSFALLLFYYSRGCSAATLCTYEGDSYFGNTVTAGSLCDGSWVGDTPNNWCIDGRSSCSPLLCAPFTCPPSPPELLKGVVAALQAIATRGCLVTRLVA